MESENRSKSEYERYYQFIDTEKSSTDGSQIIQKNAQCKICRSGNVEFVCSRKQSSTTAMRSHLKNSHPEAFTNIGHNDIASSKQPRIDESLSRIERARAVVNAEEAWIILFSKHSLSLRIVDSIEFRDFVSAVATAGKSFIPASRNTLKRRIIEKFATQKLEIVKLLSRTRCVSISFDGWSSVAMKSYFGLIIRFFDPVDEVIRQFCWDVVFLDDAAHTANNICTIVKKSNPEGVRILAACTDNAKNVLKAVKLLEHCPFRVRCLAHTLELVCSKCTKYLEKMEKQSELAVKDVKSLSADNYKLISRIRKFISHFQMSSLHKAQLRKIQEMHPDSVKPRVIIIVLYHRF